MMPAYVRTLTITNGAGTYHSEWGSVGGGILIRYDSCPTIKENIITCNDASVGAGMIISYNSDPLITKNIIYNNDSWTAGGGIFCVYDSAPNIIDNQICSNESELCSGGIGCYEGAAPLTANNHISENRAAELGGGIDCYNSEGPPGTVTIQNNVIEGNRTETFKYGGGISCSNYNAFIAGNLIVQRVGNLLQVLKRFVALQKKWVKDS